MLKRKLLVVLAAVLLSSSALASSPVHPRYSDDDLLDGRKIVNIIDDILEFWDQAEGLSLKRSRRLWLSTVEKKHQAYFDQAVYRHANRIERSAMLSEFLFELPDHIDELRRFNDGVEERIVDAVMDFKWRFPEYRQRQDIYVGVSFFRFDGSVRPVANNMEIPDTLCLGADVLAWYGADDVRVTIAHELFHLYHFNFLLRESHPMTFVTPHMPLMIEGLAVAATEAVYPNRGNERYLHFSKDQLQHQVERLELSSAEFLDLMFNGAMPEDYAGWFAQIPGEKGPARGGYLLGYEVTKRLLGSHSFEELIRMDVVQLREHAEEQLMAMALGRLVVTVYD